MSRMFRLNFGHCIAASCWFSLQLTVVARAIFTEYNSNVFIKIISVPIKWRRKNIRQINKSNIETVARCRQWFVCVMQGNFPHSQTHSHTQWYQRRQPSGYAGVYVYSGFCWNAVDVFVMSADPSITATCLSLVIPIFSLPRYTIQFSLLQFKVHRTSCVSAK